MHGPVYHALLLVKMSYCFGDLKDDVTSQVLAEICKFDDLVEQFATFHNWRKWMLTRLKVNDS